MVKRALVLSLLLIACRGDRPAPAADRARTPVRSVGEQRLRFEPVPAAAATGWDFWSYGAGYEVLLDPARLELRAHGAAPVTMRLLGGDPRGRGRGEARLPWLNHYSFEGGADDVAVPGYERVVYPAVYDGIDVVYHGVPGDVEYDFVVAPGADPARIALGFDGARDLRIDDDGALVVATAGGAFRHRRLRGYQDIDGVRRDVAVRFARRDGAVGFDVGAFDPAHPLTIDPSVLWMTYTGGLQVDSGASVDVDAQGNTYVTGTIQFGGNSPMYVRKLDRNGDVIIQRTIVQTSGSTLPRGLAVTRGATPVVFVAGMTTSPNLRTTGGALQFSCPRRIGQATCNGNRGFVARFDEALAVVAVTYLGGSTSDEINAVAVDWSDRVFVTGVTRSDDFPGTPLAISQGVVDPLRIGPFHGVSLICKQPPGGGPCEEAFVAALSGDLLRVLYFTYLGGRGSDVGRSLAVTPDYTDPALRNVHVAGGTDGNAALAAADRFPTTAIPHRNRIFPEPFVAAMGATAPGDAFVLKLVLRDQTLAFDGTSLFFSTYLGGSGHDVAHDLAVDADGAVYVTGQTLSTDLRETATWKRHYDLRGGSDAFVCKVGVMGCDLGYCGYVGGDGDDAGRAIAVSGDGYAYVTGTTTSRTGLPHVDRGNQPTCTGNPCSDAFVSKVVPRDLQRPLATDPVEWSTYLGGTGADTANGIALDDRGQVTVVGTTVAPDFDLHVAPGALLTARESFHGSSDGFAVTLGACGAPPLDLATAGEGSFRGRLASAVPQNIKTRFAGAGNWELFATVHGDDGLAVSSVGLDRRYMAERMTVPYVKVGLQGLGQPLTRCELVRDRALVPGCAGACCGNLIGFRGPHQLRQDKLYFEATYEIDLLGQGLPGARANSCVQVTQRYEFYGQAASSKGEPAGKVKISRFRPIVGYQYVGAPLVAPGDFRIVVPVRLALRPSRNIAPGDVAVAAFLHDTDHFKPTLGEIAIVEPLVANPLPVEALETVIDRGFSVASFPVFYDIPELSQPPVPELRREDFYYRAGLDNLHYSPDPGEIDLPQAVDATTQSWWGFVTEVPGCPACVHMHWRWGAYLKSLSSSLFDGFPQLDTGRPLIPPGSTQTVRVGVIAAHPGEDDPADVRDLAQPSSVTFAATANGGEDLVMSCDPVTDPRCETISSGDPATGTPPVVWYEFSNDQAHDVFFRFGGFYAAEPVFSFDEFLPPDGNPVGP